MQEVGGKDKPGERRTESQGSLSPCLGSAAVEPGRGISAAVPVSLAVKRDLHSLVLWLISCILSGQLKKESKLPWAPVMALGTGLPPHK